MILVCPSSGLNGPEAKRTLRYAGTVPSRPGKAFWLALAVKMLVTAGIVVAASLTAERAGPLIGSLIATLPVSTGPAYVFLALDHDAAFVAQSALATFVATIGAPLFALAYALTQRYGQVASLLAAQTAWLGFAVFSGLVGWTIVRAGLLATGVFAACIALSRPFRHARMPPPPRRWYDVPLRAGMVSALVLAVVALSDALGPYATGILAGFPVVFTSLILILPPRVGGPPTAAVMAHSIAGLIGFEIALGALHLTTVPLGAPAALTLGLAICVGWNLLLFSVRRRAQAR
jgi:hypothetical protein